MIFGWMLGIRRSLFSIQPFLKTTLKTVFAGLFLSLAAALIIHWRQEDEPRRLCRDNLQQLAVALRAGDSAALLRSIVLPQAVAGRTAAEQSEFLQKALADEISEAGVAVLANKGRFGTLREIFPDKAAQWAGQAGVKIDDCVAFKAERNGIQAEAVLVREGNSYRIVRCNNIKQLAQLEVAQQ